MKVAKGLAAALLIILTVACALLAVLLHAAYTMFSRGGLLTQKALPTSRQGWRNTSKRTARWRWGKC